MLATLAAMVVAAGPCFVATDASPGWKQVTLPEGAPALAADEGVPQFRPGEPVQVVDERTGLYLPGRDDGPGVTAFDFPLGAGARTLELHFAEALRGAKVDVTASGELGSMALLREQRVGGADLVLALGDNDVRAATVRVHHHLRRQPVLLGYRAVRRVAVSELRVSPAMQLPRSLYYRQPPGPAVTLCQDAGRALTLAPSSVGPGELPVPVVVRRL